ncbi:MAG: YfhO family protein, partial [Lachnospiraceae bacterium]|nr:YfhO family protein [Lachnospiraceae bacterium]
IITLCQYHIDDIYTRAAVGEVTAFIFVPLVIAGLYDLLVKNLKHPAILGLGMTGVILSHTLTTLFCLVLAVAAFLFYIAAGEKGKRRWGILKLFLTAFSVLALTAFYWAPVLEQMGSNVFRYETASFDVWFERLLFKDVFANRNPGMGIAPFLLLLPGLFFFGNKAEREKTEGGISRGGFALFSCIAGAVFTLSSTGAFPWKHFFEKLQFVQFPWRVFILASPLFAFASGIFFDALAERMAESFSGSGETAYRERRALFAGELLGLVVLSVMIASAVGNYGRNEEEYYSYSQDYFEYPRYTESVIGGEWLPENAKDRHALTDDASYAYTDGGERINAERYKNTLTLALSGKEAYADIPFVWYLGYRAEDEKGRELFSDGSGENGRMRVFPDGARNVRVTYAGTAIQHGADAISLAALLVLGAVFIVVIIRKKVKREERKKL